MDPDIDRLWVAYKLDCGNKEMVVQYCRCPSYLCTCQVYDHELHQELARSWYSVLNQINELNVMIKFCFDNNYVH